MGELNCFFHKNRTAVSKCETCGKYICLECKHESENNSYSDSSHNNICPYCYADEIENDDSSIGIVFGCVGFVIVIMIVIVLVSSMNESSVFDVGLDLEIQGGIIAIIVILVIISIGVIIYVCFKKEAQPNEEAEAIRAKAKKTIEETTNKVQASKDEKISHEALYCRFCGAPIPEYAKTCEYCGMHWQWK